MTERLRRVTSPAGPSERGDLVETALDIGLANVAVAALIALPAAGASLIRSRPALAHALWLLVLVKLLTPPLWGIHVDRPWAHTIARAAEVSRVNTARSTGARPDPIAEVLPPVEAPAEMAEVETEPALGP